MNFTEMEGFKYVEMGACAAKGFSANGLRCGINDTPGKNDLGIVFSDREAFAAAVYTTNKVKGAPLKVTADHLKVSGGRARAVVMNSKNANTCLSDGEEKAERMCRAAASALDIPEEQVLVASTGVIGQPFDVTPVENSMKELVSGLSPENHIEAEKAVMTTDTVPKEVAVRFQVEDVTYSLGGMAKGSGMIRPDMATTLSFITTDMDVAPELLQRALNVNVKKTYNCLSVDGDMSTNDMIVLMANGAAGGNRVDDAGSEGYKALENALYLVMEGLVKMLARDGEGATKLIECHVSGGVSPEQASVIAKSVISSNLVKCAMFGEDANWGRILCAIGYAETDVDIEKVDVDLASDKGRIAVCRDGAGVPFSEDTAAEILSSDEILVDVELNSGKEKGRAYGCDLSYDYVKINGDYRS
ncbi:MAG: bifunctional glutamate N-acetyltransferase/amino-acid acetyltransferase ArgJ [Lachnospiraceae bacterium]|nr:bifunctional glutamate N-acetyltransferase/amino-acid acetyltransferase ArgJ [Lachnospiraceae bacterium]